MKHKLFCISLYVGFLFLAGKVQAQWSGDMIYPVDEKPVPCRILAANSAQIQYKLLTNQQGGIQKIPKEEMLLAFKGNGSFMLPSAFGEWVQGADPKVHKIITRDQKILPAKYVAVEEDKVTYQDTASQKSYDINTGEVLLIIYKDGGHQMIADPADAAQGLAQVASRLDTYANVAPASATASTQATEASPYVNLTEAELRAFQEKAEQKGKDLGRYLSLISNKQKSDEDKIYAVDAAANLFVNDSAKVEVSTLGRAEKKQYPIKFYLNRLRLLPYDRVELVWIKAEMVSRFYKGDDGRYYGTITAQQLFRGFVDNKIQYQDVTEKNIEVVLGQYEVFDQGAKKQRWEVFLSDISVQQTRER